MRDSVEVARENVNWNEIQGESTCYCRCGSVFRSKNKTVTHYPNMIPMLAQVTEKNCPKCGKFDNYRRIVADRESFGYNVKGE